MMAEFHGMTVERGDSGFIKVKPKPYEQISKEEKTVSVESFATPIRPLYNIIATSVIPCVFGCEPWCWVTKYTAPVIDFAIEAIGIDNVDVYILAGRITGRLTTSFENKSEEGKQHQENVKTGETRNRRNVEGSADLSGSFDESVSLREIDEKLAEVTNRTIERTEPDCKIAIESEFERKGYVSLLKDIFDLLTSGTIFVDDEIKVTVEWDWLGERKRMTKKFNIKARLPVENVNYHAW